MNVDLVVCDMAGTTVYDGESVADCFQAALRSVGVEIPTREIQPLMGFHKPQAIRMMLEKTRGSTPSDAEVDAVHADFQQRMIRYYADNPAVREIPGAREFFERLRSAGVRVALNSGFGRDIIDVIVRRLEWTDIVDATIASNEVERGRPYPFMIQTLMARFGVADPKRVAKIGDTSVDLEEGTNAGCGYVIGVTTGAFTREELLNYPHTHIVNSIKEIPPILGM